MARDSVGAAGWAALGPIPMARALSDGPIVSGVIDTLAESDFLRNNQLRRDISFLSGKMQYLIDPKIMGCNVLE